MVMTNEKEYKEDGWLIAKYLLGECDEHQLREVKRRIEEDEAFARQLFHAELIFAEGKRDSGKERIQMQRGERELERRLQRKPQLNQTSLDDREKSMVRRFRLWPSFEKLRRVRLIALLAGLFLFALIGFRWYAATQETAQLLTVTTQDEEKELKLPDGTKVRLNRFTTLRYDGDSFASQRKVMIEGEGYFEVTKDEEHPFVVQSEVMQVKVLGTVFNFKSQSGSRKATTTLLQGMVEVKGNRGEGHICLSPGQMAELDAQSRRLTVKQADAAMEQWYSRTLKFEKANLNAIAATLERVYGVKVILSPNIDQQKTYTGIVPRKDQVSEVLDLLQNAMPIHYKIVGSNVFIDFNRTRPKHENPSR